jgi:hypothetical protein
MIGEGLMKCESVHPIPAISSEAASALKAKNLCIRMKLSTVNTRFKRTFIYTNGEACLGKNPGGNQVVAKAVA